jgi:hypothetical protein
MVSASCFRSRAIVVALVFGLPLAIVPAYAQRGTPTRPAPAARGTQGLERLQQSTRPTRYVGSFKARDGMIAITDVGFSVQGPRETTCYWFGQLDSIQQERRLDDPKAAPRSLLGWRRDDIRPVTIGGPDAGDFPAFERALQGAYRAWTTKYADVTARLRAAGQSGGFGDLVKQARSDWYNDATKTVGCEDAQAPQAAGQLPAGLSAGSTWTGTMEATPIELQLLSASSATITYNGVKETFEVQLLLNGEIQFSGMSYEFLPGTPPRIFSLDTFRGRLSADAQSIAGMWKDAGSGTGRWSVTRAKP